MLYVGLILILIVLFAMPYIWMIGSTFKPRTELFENVYPLTWKTFVPLSPTFENIRTIFTEYNFDRALLNSAGLAVFGVFFSVTINSLIAFVLAWVEFPGRRVLFITILATMLIAFEAKLVPLFLVIQDLNIYNTYFAMLVPWLTDAFFIFLFRQHFKELPEELYESAVMDGCSPFRIYWNIMLPNITPALISAAFIKFIYTWDSYLWPLVSVRDESKTVITVAIAKLFADDYVLWELVFAGSFIATIPVLILFIFLQRYYVQGFVTSGLKG
jgi:ABC-type glycerol-3-phosphate transport system permease component